jgi:hypothetical protein
MAPPLPDEQAAMLLAGDLHRERDTHRRHGGDPRDRYPFS